MKKFIVRAEKAPDADDAENWDIKIIGMNVEQAKEWTATSFGKNWTIRYTLPSEDTYPCFLLTKRSSETAAAILTQGAADLMEQSAQFKIQSGGSSVIPGKSYEFTLISTAH